VVLRKFDDAAKAKTADTNGGRRPAENDEAVERRVTVTVRISPRGQERRKAEARTWVTEWCLGGEIFSGAKTRWGENVSSLVRKRRGYHTGGGGGWCWGKFRYRRKSRFARGSGETGISSKTKMGVLLKKEIRTCIRGREIKGSRPCRVLSNIVQSGKLS